MQKPIVCLMILPLAIFLAGCVRQADNVARQPQTDANSDDLPDRKNQEGQSDQIGLAVSSGQGGQTDSESTPIQMDEIDDLVEVEEESTEIHTIEIPDSWKRLGKNEIWADFQAKQVVIGGYVCLERGLLEMFVCPMGTKEHESVIAALAPAVEMHAALLAIGAQPGSPSSWSEETGFVPPSGSKIEIEVRWLDEETDQVVTRDSRQMIQNTQTGQAMKYDWVFAGSQTYEDPETGQKYYYANSGDMICVSNFPSAAIDIGTESSSDNESLMFQVYEENVPPLGTKVYLILTPGEYIGTEPEPKKN